MDDREYLQNYTEVVGDPRFRLFGLTREQMLKVNRSMMLWNARTIEEILKPDPEVADAR